jgi:predicted ABC-type ATPase
MTTLPAAVEQILAAQIQSGKPLAIVVAGHNGSGKSTMWTRRLAPALQIPLINADRMMMSILPEPVEGRLPAWAAALRDQNESWMSVSQKGVDAFVVQAMAAGVPFAMETVFSHWQPRAGGGHESKIDRILEMQAAGYFVLLLFVGLSDTQLSMGRVATRIARGGHAVPPERLEARYPRTQAAIRAALPVADAAILTDNSREEDQAFTVCRIQMRDAEVFDLRRGAAAVPAEILAWLDVVCPLAAPA